MLTIVFLFYSTNTRLVWEGERMQFRRRWAQWPKRISHELNGLSGVAGLGGVALGAGGLSFLAGTAAFVFTGLGAVVVVGATSYAAYKAIPPSMRRAEDLVGQFVELNELDNIHPALKKLSIIGQSQAGKTTLKNRLAFDRMPVRRTQNISAYIASLQTAPPTYIAILDGDGDRYSQQFILAEKCDLLCIVVDHNKSDAATLIDSLRTADHQSFLKQVKHHLDQAGVARKSWVQLLINKRDLWRTEPKSDQDKLVAIFASEAEEFQRGKYAEHVESQVHSNDIAHDVALFMEQLKKFTKN